MELRNDPLLGRSVIVAPGRAARPHAFAPQSIADADPDCPFCPGSEHTTPGELLAFREVGSLPNSPGWRVRVVPNKYPAIARNDVVPNDEISGDTSICEPDCVQPAYGAHEVIIESQRHVEGLTGLSDDEAAEVFIAYQQRLQAAKADDRLRYATIFKNVGPSAGASLAHTHSQLMAMSSVPRSAQAELDRARDYFDRNGRCAFCDLIERERKAGVRIVEETDELLVLCPYVSRLPLEMCLLPRKHSAQFEQISAESLAHLAHVLRSALTRLEAVLGRVAYNYIIVTSPFDTLSTGHYHWRIEVLPRLTTMAGFEWGSGCYINPVPPEEAAAMLRRRQLAASFRR
jgi:UDPglucose--hexose-1-phosphate uridylyltransferase